MKPNPYRMWSIEFTGDGDKDYFQKTVHETVDGVLMAANELEDEFDWQANVIRIVAVSNPGVTPQRKLKE